jgi:hypothetical protein
MILAANRSRTFLQPQLQRQRFPDQLQIPHHQFEQLQLVPGQRQQPAFADSLRSDGVLDLDFDIDADLSSHSLSSSPLSTQSLLSQYSSPPYPSLQHSPLSAIDSVPGLVGAEHQVPLFGVTRSARSSFSDPSSVLFGTEPMPESWISAQRSMLKSAARAPAHHRDSSLSSLASAAGPASPYTQTTSVHPHIAVTDTIGDAYMSGGVTDDFLSFHNPKPMGSDSYYANFPAYNPVGTADASALAAAYPNVPPAPKRRAANRGLQIPTSAEPHSAKKSRPLSVASSVASDSPATPAAEADEDARHPRNVLHVVPKLDRTMTDVYSDELYNPNFTMAPASAGPVDVSPTQNEVFTQRLQAANSQHLNTAQSPMSTISRGLSPFRNGSPLAPVPAHDFATAMDTSQARWHAAQLAHPSHRLSTDAASHHTGSSIDSDRPETISPKDALLEYHEPGVEATFPLFPPDETAGFDAEQVNKAAAAAQVQQELLDGLSGGLQMDNETFNTLLNAQLPLGLQMPQQYPFISQQQQQQQQPSAADMTTGMSSPASTNSGDVGASDQSSTASPQRPASTLADSGTYTCTYHGCTQRFDTPALLQKHKREGHRQANNFPGAPGGSRRPDASVPGMTAGLFNSQAGPHRCDRINPSTGKPCAQVFSRPYDLTRHEDTIHNARKQKVRCDLCTEEKTFSRADALTRHYRVCHPGHEVQGKHRKRASQSG